MSLSGSKGRGTFSDRLAHLAARATTLTERLALAGSPPDPSALTSALAPWARAFARGDEDALRRRLAWDGISPAAAAAALTTEPEPHRPGWVAELLDWGVLGMDPGFHDEDEPTHSLPFGELWEPWVAVARRELARTTPLAAEIPVDDLERLAHGLTEELARIGALAAYERFVGFRAAEAAATGGRANPGSYSRFVAAVRRDGYLDLFESFPVLLRQIHRLVTSWRDSLAELLERLAADREALTVQFGRGEPLGTLVQLERLPSDRHDGRWGIFALAFVNGLELVYKPRSLAPEAVLDRAARWLAATGLAAPPRTLAVLERSGYGWMLRARPGTPGDEAGRRAWYASAGALVALAELLGGQDLHAENIIATRSGPVVVDAEMLLQPLRAGADPTRDASFAAGLLARPGAYGREAAWAGLEPVRPRRLPGQRRVWTGIGTDEIAPAGEPAMTEPLANTLVVAGKPIAPSSYSSALLDGYTAAWRAVASNRAAFLDSEGPLRTAAAAPVRLLFRPSQEYASVLDLLSQPRYQRDGVTAELLLEALLRPFADHRTRPLLWPLVAVERAALLGLDLPRFEVLAGSTTVASGKEPIAGLLLRSGVDEVRRRLAELDEGTLARRRAAIAEALKARASSFSPRRAWATAPGDIEAAALRSGDALVEAIAAEPPLPRSCSLADRLAALAIYDGLLGVLLALAEVDALDDGERVVRAAGLFLSELEPLVSALDSEEAAALPVGVLSGIGSLVWGLVSLATGGRTIAEEALATAVRIARRISPAALGTDERLDLEGGAAGAALGLLAVSQATGDEQFLIAARAAGLRLLERRDSRGAWPGVDGVARSGFAHGASGIARSLAALAKALDEPRFAAAAAAGFAFEHSELDPARGNWPVVATDPRLGEHRPTWMVAWCHGAPGIALARAVAAEVAGDTGEHDLEVAVATTMAAGLTFRDHLCCGSAGRIAVLDALGRRRHRADWRDAAQAGGMQLRTRAAAADELNLPPGPASARRGLFRGVAGIAWTLARLAGAARTPDLLVFESPVEAAGRNAETLR